MWRVKTRWKLFKIFYNFYKKNSNIKETTETFGWLFFVWTPWKRKFFQGSSENPQTNCIFCKYYPKQQVVSRYQLMHLWTSLKSISTTSSQVAHPDLTHVTPTNYGNPTPIFYRNTKLRRTSSILFMWWIRIPEAQSVDGSSPIKYST